MAVEISSSDVVKLVQQFLKENNLINTMKTLQEESGVMLDTTDHFQDQLEPAILAGQWDKVITLIHMFRLPQSIVAQLYEQIIIELIEGQEFDCSGWLFTRSAFQKFMKVHHPERLAIIQQWLAEHSFNRAEAYPHGRSRQDSRQLLVQSIQMHLNDVAPSRLLTLLGQSLKWQQHQGVLPPGQHIDIFLGRASSERLEEDMPLKLLLVQMEFNAESYPECAIFSPDGQFLITGSADGFIEIWNFSTGKLRKDLIYQAQNRLMVMESAVLALACSSNSKILASGSKNGKIRIWNLTSGSCIQKFEGMHQSGTNCLKFYKSDSQLFSCSFDSTIKLLSLSSGKILKEFKGHTSFVYDIQIIEKSIGQNTNLLISASADSSIRIWNIKTTECLKIFRPMENIPIYQIVPLKANNNNKDTNHINEKSNFDSSSLSEQQVDSFLVLFRSNSALIMDISGRVLTTLNSGQTKDGSDFVLSAISPCAKLAYCLAEDGQIYVFDIKTGKFEMKFDSATLKPLGLVHHPFHNVCAVYGEDSKMNIWTS